MKQLIADWSHALALVIVPSALVGAFLSGLTAACQSFWLFALWLKR
jgi:hypothetical protein